jgi:cytochrome c556
MKNVAIAALVLAATALPVAAQQMKPEDQIHLRQSTMALIGYNFGSLAAMAQEKKPFNKEEAQRAADILPMLAALPKPFFGEGTETGGNTKAKPEIWKNLPDFSSKLDKMQQEVGKLPEVVRSGDMAAFKKQVSDTSKACKSCHDDYRSK